MIEALNRKPCVVQASGRVKMDRNAEGNVGAKDVSRLL